MMHDESYKRGQVEEALWALQWSDHTPPGGPPAAPLVFRTRIKRLLDIDRSGKLSGQGGENGEAYAFSEGKPGRQGLDVGFSAFDAFCLAIGLELLGAGFKQLEVVVMVRLLRGQLRDEFDRLARIIEELGPVRPRGRFWSVKEAPSLPTVTIDGREVADHRVYALIQRVDLKEKFPLLVQKLARMKKAARPAVLLTEPKFVHGIEALHKHLHVDMPLHYRLTILLELSRHVSDVIHLLRRTSASKRGPK